MKRLLLLLFLASSLMTGFFLRLPELEMPALSPVLLDRNSKVLCIQLTPDEKWRLPVTLAQIPPLYLKMLVAYEDKRFYHHHGIDPLAMARAIWQWATHGRIISGGSTLTMQTARLLNPRPRTILYKIEEIFQALRLEWIYSKEDILKMYLVLAPYGGNIEGIRAASRAYFQQEPQGLTPAQQALLVVMPQLPTALRPHIYPQRAKAFRDKVLRRLAREGILTSLQVEEAMRDPVPGKRSVFPAHASHVMSLLRQRFPGQTIYQTTLEFQKQVALEDLLRQESVFLEPHQTAAALIVDNESHHIVAYVGSAEPWSEPRNGYVDMIRAIRSPGSTLKPLIYALAFEENLIHPETLIDDVATNFNGYTPTNFRDAFHGEVTIREALQQSLNIPAVHLLNQLGPGRFVDWLRNHDTPLFFNSTETIPALPIALGGAGIRLGDLVALYCALANQGAYTPLTLTLPSFTLPAKVFVHPVASWYVTRILEDAPAPAHLVDWLATSKTPVAFKTGTSYGARDALCIGYTTGPRSYTAGVWTGRADGTPSPNQLGRTTAAPILLKIFTTIVPCPLQQESLSSLIPPGVLLTSNALLPEALRRFRHTYTARRAESEKPYPVSLRFITPQTSTTHLLQKRDDRSSFFTPIPVAFRGGTPPFMLFVNGQPADIPFLNHKKPLYTFSWKPVKAGFFELILLDGAGQSDTITIRLTDSAP